MSTKNPYEIRLDILKMARELVMEEMYTKRDYVMELWQANNRSGNLDWPEFPSNEQILAKAQELYQFVETKPADLGKRIPVK